MTPDMTQFRVTAEVSRSAKAAEPLGAIHINLHQIPTCQPLVLGQHKDVLVSCHFDAISTISNISHELLAFVSVSVRSRGLRRPIAKNL